MSHPADRRLRFALLAPGLAVTSCVAPVPTAPPNDGYTHFYKAGTFDCPPGPIAVDGSHLDITLQGACGRVRLAGSHDDVTVYVPPGAVIEVTGDHDDVVWRLIRRGAPPRIVNSGDRNTIVRNSRAPWEQDHDWYQEQR